MPAMAAKKTTWRLRFRNSHPAADCRLDAARRCSRRRSVELEGEIEAGLVVPVPPPQIEAGLEQPDFVANPLRHERRLRVIEHDALLAVEQTRSLVDLGDDGVEA